MVYLPWKHTILLLFSLKPTQKRVLESICQKHNLIIGNALFIYTTRLFPPSTSILFPSIIKGNESGSTGSACHNIKNV